jgi:hypothetical protein
MPSDRKKDSHSSKQLSLLVDMHSPGHVFEEVKTLYLDMFDRGELSPLIAVYEDTLSLFQGKYPGYKACDTPYHNLKHTTDVFLAMARLLHGAQVAGENLSEADVNLGLIAALMHDTGYVRRDSDNHHRSGAQLTPMHVRRSVEFMTRCLVEKGYTKENILQTEHIVLCTDHENASGNVHFSSNNHRLLSNMIASADLLAQTADRIYLEKLPLLYCEFKEVGYGNYNNELDLIKDAVYFNDHMHERLVNQLDDVKRFLTNHFKVRWHIDEDLYRVAINHSMAYLASVLDSNTKNFRIHFRRALNQSNKMSK